MKTQEETVKPIRRLTFLTFETDKQMSEYHVNFYIDTGIVEAISFFIFIAYRKVL